MADEPTDYTDTPVSIGELRTERSANARDWTPRELLISLLREIDSGQIEPTDLVVGYSWELKENPGTTVHGWRASSQNITTTLGILAHTTNKVCNP